MATPLDPKTGTFEYVLTEDKEKPAAEQTKFILRYISRREFSRIIDGLHPTADGGDIANQQEWGCEVLDAALVGWKNFGDLKFSKQNDAHLNHLSQQQLLELATNVMHENRLSEDQRKNSK